MATPEVPTTPDAATTADPTTSGAALVDALERLAVLHRRGHLDDAEYAAAKARLLGTDEPEPGP